MKTWILRLVVLVLTLATGARRPAAAQNVAPISAEVEAPDLPEDMENQQHESRIHQTEALPRSDIYNSHRKSLGGALTNMLSHSQLSNPVNIHQSTQRQSHHQTASSRGGKATQEKSGLENSLTKAKQVANAKHRQAAQPPTQLRLGYRTITGKVHNIPSTFTNAQISNSRALSRQTVSTQLLQMQQHLGSSPNLNSQHSDGPKSTAVNLGLTVKGSSPTKTVFGASPESVPYQHKSLQKYQNHHTGVNLSSGYSQPFNPHHHSTPFNPHHSSPGGNNHPLAASYLRPATGNEMKTQQSKNGEMGLITGPGIPNRKQLSVTPHQQATGFSGTNQGSEPTREKPTGSAMNTDNNNNGIGQKNTSKLSSDFHPSGSTIQHSSQWVSDQRQHGNSPESNQSQFWAGSGRKKVNIGSSHNPVYFSYWPASQINWSSHRVKRNAKISTLPSHASSVYSLLTREHFNMTGSSSVSRSSQLETAQNSLSPAKVLLQFYHAPLQKRQIISFMQHLFKEEILAGKSLEQMMNTALSESNITQILNSFFPRGVIGLDGAITHILNNPGDKKQMNHPDVDQALRCLFMKKNNRVDAPCKVTGDGRLVVGSLLREIKESFKKSLSHYKEMHAQRVLYLPNVLRALYQTSLQQNSLQPKSVKPEASTHSKFNMHKVNMGLLQLNTINKHKITEEMRNPVDSAVTPLIPELTSVTPVESPVQNASHKISQNRITTDAKPEKTKSSHKTATQASSAKIFIPNTKNSKATASQMTHPESHQTGNKRTSAADWSRSIENVMKYIQKLKGSPEEKSVKQLMDALFLLGLF